MQRIDTGEKMVVKHIPLEDLDENEMGCALKEVAALQQLDHPNIVKCFGSWVMAGDEDDSGRDESSRPWHRENEKFRLPLSEAHATWADTREHLGALSSLNILTEYMDGGSLDKVIARNEDPFDEMVVGIWLAQIILGIDQMHRHKILHRDIKPANIFITKSGIVKIGDLGCVKMLSKPDEECSSEYGSPLYLSPEVWRNGMCSHKSDIWAIGCVAHELLAREPPFATPELAYKVLNNAPPPLPDSVSAPMRELIDKMLLKDHGARPSSEQILRMPCMAEHVGRWMKVAFAPVSDSA